jgi:hypothetical protein
MDAGGAAVAEHGPAAAGQHGGHPAALVAQRTMAERVDAAVQRDEAPGAPAPLDRLGAEAQLEQLAPCNDAVLGLGEAPDLAVDVRLGSHINP